MCEYCDDNKTEYLSKRRDDIYGKEFWEEIDFKYLSRIGCRCRRLRRRKNEPICRKIQGVEVSSNGADMQAIRNRWLKKRKSQMAQRLQA